MINPVIKMIDAFLEVWPQASFGPGHIVLDDWSLLDENIEMCINLAKAAVGKSDVPYYIEWAEEMEYLTDHSADEINSTIAFLEMLSYISEDTRYEGIE